MALCTLWGQHHVMIIHGILCFIVCKRIEGQLHVLISMCTWMPRIVGNGLRVCYDQCSTRDIAHPCVLSQLVVSWYRIDVPTYLCRRAYYVTGYSWIQPISSFHFFLFPPVSNILELDEVENGSKNGFIRYKLMFQSWIRRYLLYYNIAKWLEWQMDQNCVILLFWDEWKL